MSTFIRSRGQHDNDAFLLFLFRLFFREEIRLPDNRTSLLGRFAYLSTVAIFSTFVAYLLSLSVDFVCLSS